MNKNKNKKVIFFTSALRYGGDKQVLVNLAKHLQETYDIAFVDVYGKSKPYISDLAALNIQTYIATPQSKKDFIGGQGTLKRFWKIMAAIPSFIMVIMRVRKLFKKISPRIVVVSGVKTLFLAKYALPGKVSIVYYAMGEFAHKPFYIYRLFNRIDLAIGLSKSCLGWLLQSKHPPKSTAVVYNSIEIENIINQSKEQPADLPGRDKSLKLLFPARIISTKGQDIAVRAVKEFLKTGGDIQLWLSGCKPRGYSGQYPDFLLNLISELGLEDSVSFIGFRENLFPIMAASDAIILTSETEGMPCCLMEGMALQKPVIATTVGGIPELVRDQVDGFLVEYGDVDGVAKALNAFQDPALRAKMGHAAKTRIMEEFLIEKQIAGFAEQIDALLSL